MAQRPSRLISNRPSFINISQHSAPDLTSSSRPATLFSFKRLVLSPNEGSRSAPSPQYLTPPTLKSPRNISHVGTPPAYKPDSGDYFSLNMHQARHKKHKSTRHHLRSMIGEDLPDAKLPLLESENLPTSSASHKSDESDMGSMKVVQGSAFCTPRPLHEITQKSLEANIRHPQLGAEEVVGKPYETSAAVQNERRGLIGTEAAPIPSYINVHASEVIQISTLAAEQYKSMIQLVGNPDSSTHTSDHQSRKKRKHSSSLETPATIFLRKASGMFQDIEAREMHNATKAINALPQLATSQGPQSLTVSLTRNQPEFFSGPLSPRARDPYPDNIRQMTESSKKRKSLSGLRNANDPASYGQLADTATTFAEVHTSPTTFSGNSALRVGSLSLGQRLQRRSVVQTISRSSVHEVIWNDADSPSWFSDDSRSANMSPSVLEPEDGSESNPSPTSTNGRSRAASEVLDLSRLAMISEESREKAMTFERPAPVLHAWSWSRRGSGVVGTNNKASFPAISVLAASIGLFSASPDRKTATDLQQLRPIASRDLGSNVDFLHAVNEGESTDIRPFITSDNDISLSDNPPSKKRRSSLKGYAYAPNRDSPYSRRVSWNEGRRRSSNIVSHQVTEQEQGVSLLKRNDLSDEVPLTRSNLETTKRWLFSSPTQMQTNFATRSQSASQARSAEPSAHTTISTLEAAAGPDELPKDLCRASSEPTRHASIDHNTNTPDPIDCKTQSFVITRLERRHRTPSGNRAISIDYFGEFA